MEVEQWLVGWCGGCWPGLSVWVDINPVLNVISHTPGNDKPVPVFESVKPLSACLTVGLVEPVDHTDLRTSLIIINPQPGQERRGEDPAPQLVFISKYPPRSATSIISHLRTRGEKSDEAGRLLNNRVVRQSWISLQSPLTICV